MAIDHSAITDPYVHEPKNITTATSGESYIANGAGSGTWHQYLTRWDLAIAGLAAVGANTSVERVVTLTGIIPGTHVCISCSKPTFQAGLFIANAEVTNVDEITLTYVNVTAAPITPADETCDLFTWSELS